MKGYWRLLTKPWVVITERLPVNNNIGCKRPKMASFWIIFFTIHFDQTAPALTANFL